MRGKTFLFCAAKHSPFVKPKKLKMKKLTVTLSIFCSVFLSLNAQYCGTSGSSTCTPTGGPSNGGFAPPDSVPCAVQGVAYSFPIQFTMFSTFNYLGQQNVDSIEFDVAHGGLQNLPCGLCWSTNHANNRFKANEDGCLLISGTTNDAPGQYKLAINLKAWINGQPTGLSIPAATVDLTGIKLYVRVKSSGGSCTGVDTSSGANNLTASISCPTGINEVDANISGLNVQPNPMTNGAVINFNTAKAAIYTLRVTDITGKEVLFKEIEARTGENKIAMERNNLTAGIYFVQLNDGKFSVTKKFTVAD
jgi:hypothetical protein